MPVIDVLLVKEGPSPAGLAPAIADAIGRAIDAPAGRVWVRLHFLPSEQYAENDGPIADELPVFVSILEARPPSGDALAARVKAVTLAVAGAVSRPVERVHVEFAPPGSGRVAFGGRPLE
jgi:phenylpyruvate tautomerase PptA (4-oxalocrotonate tautomerase family)